MSDSTPEDNSSQIDNIIYKLLEACEEKRCRNAKLSEEEITLLCERSREIFASQPILLELECPLKICGKFIGS